MNDPLYRATMLTAMSSMLRIVIGSSIRAVDQSTRAACDKLCETMDKMARYEEQRQAVYGDYAEAVHAAYSTVLPPTIMLTEAEKVRSFDRLRAKLYPEGRDPFGSHR